MNSSFLYKRAVISSRGCRANLPKSRGGNRFEFHTVSWLDKSRRRPRRVKKLNRSPSNYLPPARCFSWIDPCLLSSDANRSFRNKRSRVFKSWGCYFFSSFAKVGESSCEPNHV